MLIVFPYSTEVLIKRWPFSNLGIMLVTIAISYFDFAGYLSDDLLAHFVLDGWSPLGLIGHQFLHLDMSHLLGNMFFLWVFGNAVCETTGNRKYLLLYPLLGVLAAVFHNVFAGGTVVGASGAINGIIGFYLVLFPTNRVSCFYWFLIRIGTFEISGWWVLIAWFLLDAWGAFFGMGGTIAYWAHVGGFVSGLLLGLWFEKAGWAQLQKYDNPSLMDLLRKDQPSALNRSHKTRTELINEHKQQQERIRKRPSFPSEEETLIVACPYCLGEIEFCSFEMGQTLICPTCGEAVEIAADDKIK